MSRQFTGGAAEFDVYVIVDGSGTGKAVGMKQRFGYTPRERQLEAMRFAVDVVAPAAWTHLLDSLPGPNAGTLIRVDVMFQAGGIPCLLELTLNPTLQSIKATRAGEALAMAAAKEFWTRVTASPDAYKWIPDR